jgi:4-amino-4-deoxy-L-arabinose transferase-like glycosyltransferase
LNFTTYLNVSRIWKCALWALVVWVVIFWRLGYPSLLDPDEAHYAELTREMVHARNWMVPLLDGTPFIDKPILFHWLQAASITALGESEFALRLPSALATIALIATTWWLGAEIFTAEIGEWAAMMFVTLPATFALASIGMIDMVYTAFLFGGVACLIVAALRDRPKLQDPGYVLIALAVMTKGPVALVLPALLVGTALLSGADLRAAVGKLAWIRGLAIATLAACPWFVWMWGRFGDQFINGYVLAGNVWYFTQPAEFSGRTTNATFYLRIFATAFFPWSIIVIGRLIDVVVDWRRQRAPDEARVLWLWLFVVIGFFTAARFRLDHYIFPMAPACCLLAARAWRSAAGDGRWRWTRVSVQIIAAAMVVGGLVASVALFEINLGLDASALTLPLALVAGGLALAFQIIRRRGLPPASIAVPFATLIAVYAVVVVIGLPILEQSRPTAPLGRWIAEHSPPNSTVGIYRVNDWQASLRYYAGRRIVRLETPEELSEFFDRFPDAYVVMIERDARRLLASGIDVREAVGRPAIVGRTGRYLRKQVWDRLVVVKRPAPKRLGAPTT